MSSRTGQRNATAPSPALPVGLRRLLLPALLLFSGMAEAGNLSPEEARGKSIYFHGRSLAGEPITALVGRAATPVPASALPCVNCHGADGLGRAERGVLPPQITWDYLTKPYGHEHDNGRRHPAFTEAGLARAMIDGVDPTGHALDVAMPRYGLSEVDLADLVAYLKRLGRDLDPGLEDGRIRIGSLLPGRGRLAAMGTAVARLLEAYFAELNRSGGIYGRAVDLVLAQTAEGPEAILADTRRLIEEASVFALVAAMTAGAEAEVAGLLEEQRVPLVGPFTLFPADDASLGRFTFFLGAGIREQARVLVEYAATRLELDDPPLAVVHPPGAAHEAVVRAVGLQAAAHGWSSVSNHGEATSKAGWLALAQTLHRDSADPVLFLGSRPGLMALVAALESVDWRPRLLLPAALASDELFDWTAGRSDRILLAYPGLPGSQGPAATQAFAKLHRSHGLAPQHMGAQIAAYVAAQVLVEGLKRAGKDPSRERLVSALEHLNAFEPGLLPAVSYGPNRRIGALGAYVVAVDGTAGRFVPSGPWIELSE